MSWNRSWPKYVSVADLREKSERKIAKLRKQKKEIQPVQIEGSVICRTVWAKAWSRHLDTYADANHRLGRGRKYVRCGCVYDLSVVESTVQALVGGTRAYKVDVDVAPLSATRKRTITNALSGDVGSLADLLLGKVSKDVMAVVANPVTGLFPTIGDLTLSCTCPDGDAYLCKHVAAALYGIAARLDEDPALLFTLRGLDPASLLTLPDIPLPSDTNSVGIDLPGAAPIEGADLSAVFGITVDTPQTDTADTGRQVTKGSRAKKAVSKTARTTTKKAKKKTTAKTKSKKPTATKKPARKTKTRAKANLKKASKKKATKKTSTKTTGKGKQSKRHASDNN